MLECTCAILTGCMPSQSFMLGFGFPLSDSSTDFCCISTPRSWPCTCRRAMIGQTYACKVFPCAVQAQRHFSCVLATNMANNIQQHCQLGQMQTSCHACRHMHTHDGCHTCVGCITDHNAQQIAQHSAVMSRWCSEYVSAMHVRVQSPASDLRSSRLQQTL